MGHSLQPVEKKQKWVANTLKLPKRGFSERKQHLALFCSLLRYVWQKYEARRVEWTHGRPNPEGMALMGPANGIARCAAFFFAQHRKTRSVLIRKLTLNRGVHHVPCTIALILVCGFLSPPLSAETAWGRSSAFNLDEGAQRRKKASQVTDRVGSLWGANGPQNVWSDLDAFERSKPGKTPPPPARFTLPSGPKLDQLFSVIASVDLSTKADIASLGRDKVG